ncbi:isochorismatase family protein [Microvirga flavescens]|uniref:isochorismatase family protein n=1 Tax=Microvirga flavescens TaxID=2249811 RepID=UPI000DD806BB|nr:isochorismatase family protein [Microvirga flavescens]
MLLTPARSQLIVIDIQERLLPAIAEAERVVKNTNILLTGADRLGIPVTVTEQYPKGLGATVASLSKALSADAMVLPKMTFSAAADAGIAKRVGNLRNSGLDQIVLCGTEAHVCVLQSALAFKAAGADVFVVGDAVSSRSPHSVAAAEARLVQAGCRWITTEMAIFEWLEQAGTDDFKALSALIK